MRPWEVSASQSRRIGPASWVGSLQLAPPSGEEMKPTFSSQLAAVQLAFG
jgi:hypothetical protein